MLHDESLKIFITNVVEILYPHLGLHVLLESLKVPFEAVLIVYVMSVKVIRPILFTLNGFYDIIQISYPGSFILNFLSISDALVQLKYYFRLTPFIVISQSQPVFKMILFVLVSGPDVSFKQITLK
jgi:hypothetical protein